MRLAITILGYQLIDITLDRDQAEAEHIEHGLPFDFSGGSLCQAERAEDWTPLDD